MTGRVVSIAEHTTRVAKALRLAEFLTLHLQDDALKLARTTSPDGWRLIAALAAEGNPSPDTRKLIITALALQAADVPDPFKGVS